MIVRPTHGEGTGGTSPSPLPRVVAGSASAVRAKAVLLQGRQALVVGGSNVTVPDLVTRASEARGKLNVARPVALAY